MLLPKLDLEKTQDNVSKRIQYYMEQGLPLEESLYKVSDEVEENIQEWGTKAAGDICSHISFHQFQQQILGGRKKHMKNYKGSGFPPIQIGKYITRKKYTSKGIITYKDPQPQSGKAFRSVITGPADIGKYPISFVTVLAAIRKKGMTMQAIADMSEEFFGFKMSQSTVSRILKDFFDNVIKEFNEKPIKDPHLIRTVKVDALYKTIRGFGKIAVYVVKVIKDNGRERWEEIVAILINPPENAKFWTEVFMNVYERGLRIDAYTILFVADGHPGIRKGLLEVYREADFQGCQFHKMSNLQEKFNEDKRDKKNKDDESVKEVRWPPIRNRIYKDIFHVLDKKRALQGLERFSKEFLFIFPRLVIHLWACFDEMTTYLDHDLTYAVQNRTTGCLERDNREIRRFTNGVNSYPTLGSLQRVLIPLCQSMNEKKRKRGIRVQKNQMLKHISQASVIPTVV